MAVKKLNDFMCGFISCLAAIAHEDPQYAVEEYRAAGEPTIAQIKASGMGEFEIEGIKKIRRYIK